MNCPGHMLLFGSQLRSYRDLPLRFAESAPLHRNELGGTLHGLLRVRQVTQDDAHVFCTEEQIEEEIVGVSRLRRLPLRPLRDGGARSSSPRGPKQARDRRGLGPHGGRASGGARAAGDPYRRRGRGRVLRPEDRPPHGRRARSTVADGDDPARRPDAGAVRLHVHGRRQPRAHAVRHPPRAVRLARAVHRHPDRALRRRVPRLARARPGARAAGRREATARRRRGSLARLPRRACGSTSTSATRRSAGGSATPSWRRSRTSSSGATASPTTRSPCACAGRRAVDASARRARRRARRADGLQRLRDADASDAPLLRCAPAKQERIRPSPPGA